MKFDNVLTRMIGTQYPIIQGAFGWRGTGSSSIAVPTSEAGGLGVLTTISYGSPDEFQEDVRNAKAMTDKPFAVNFTLMPDTKYDNDWHRDYIKITLEEGIKTIFTSAYDGSYIGRIFKDAGCNWIHKCATVRHAVSIAGKGCDAVVIVGLEGTGFKSEEQHTTLINITTARKMMSVPLIAAGGIGDARGFVAALAMGAVGVYLGTVFMATREFKIGDKLKNKIAGQEPTDIKHRNQIYGMDHGAAHSLAAGVVTGVPTIKELMDTMVAEAEEVMAELKQWGMLA